MDVADVDVQLGDVCAKIVEWRLEKERGIGGELVVGREKAEDSCRVDGQGYEGGESRRRRSDERDG